MCIVSRQVLSSGTALSFVNLLVTAGGSKLVEPRVRGRNVQVSVHIESLLSTLAPTQVNAYDGELKLVLHTLWTGPSSIGKGHKSDPIRDYALLQAYDSGRRERGARRRGGEGVCSWVLNPPGMIPPDTPAPSGCPKDGPRSRSSPASTSDHIQHHRKRPSCRPEMDVSVWLGQDLSWQNHSGGNVLYLQQIMSSDSDVHFIGDYRRVAATRTPFSVSCPDPRRL